MKKTLKQILQISLITLSCNPVIIDKGRPKAYFTYYPKNPCVNEPVLFNGSGSVDDGEILEHHWVFGDGNTGKEEKAVNKYKDAKIYKVKLTVTDNDLKTDDYIGYIEIINCEES